MSNAVTVSIVSHGHLELVRSLLTQLDAHCNESIQKVILTINVPEIEGLEGLEGLQFRFPVERIDNPSPKGFGANHNQAFLLCRTPWFLVLNPDINFDNDVISPLIETAKTQSGLLAPRILEPGKSQPEAHRAIITPLEILTRARAGYVKPTHPAWLPGLFMLFRADAFEKVKGFDERFFMYGEDFDLCARIQLAGWQLQVGENLLAIHDARRASHASFRHFFWHATSLIKIWTSRTFWRYRKLSE